MIIKTYKNTWQYDHGDGGSIKKIELIGAGDCKESKEEEYIDNDSHMCYLRD